MRDTLTFLVSNYDKAPGDCVRITLAVFKRDDMAIPIGWVTYGPLPSDEYLKEIGYAIDPKEWGKGYATEAVTAFIGWIRANVTRDELFATVDENNCASIRVLEKVGMKLLNKGYSKKQLRAGRGHAMYMLEERPQAEPAAYSAGQPAAQPKSSPTI